MRTCRTRRSMSPMGTSPSTSAPRSSLATTSRPRSRRRSAATSTSRRAAGEGFDEIIVRVGIPARAARSDSSASSSASGSTRRTAASRPSASIAAGPGKYVLHTERSPDYSDRRRRGQAGRLARLSRRRQHQLREQPRRVDARGHRDARRAPRADPVAALRHGRRLGQAADRRGPRHLIARRRRRRLSGRCGMTALRAPVGDPRDRAAQVVRRAGRPRRHRPRGRRGHGLRAPRAERRRQDDDGPHPLDAHRRRRRRGPGRRPRRRPRAGRGPRGLIGVTGQFSAVDKQFTGEENLRLMADLRHLGRAEGRRRVDGAARAVRPRRRGEEARLDLLRRHAPPARPRDDAHRRPADHLPRRADGRPRSAQPAGDVADRSASSSPAASRSS